MHLVGFTIETRIGYKAIDELLKPACVKREISPTCFGSYAI